MILLSLKNLLRNKSRSLLTTLGIIIGVAAVTSLVSVSEGITAEASSALGGLQYFMLMEESVFDESMSVLDAGLIDKVARVRGVKSYAPEITFFATSFNDKSIDQNSFTSGGVVQVRGIDPTKVDDFKNNIFWYNVNQGRMIKPGEDNAVVINEELASDENLFLGSIVEINGDDFEVVGFFKMESGLSQFSNFVVITIDKARSLTNYESDEIGYINVSPDDFTKVEKFITRLESVFPELKVFSSEQASELIGRFLGNLTIALWFVSGIAGVVGGIGVMNTMLMSVMERITEFGVLKAVGWKNNHIVLMIIGEAVLIGLTGGVIGLILGYTSGYLVEYFSGIPTSISFNLMLEVLLFAISIGVISSIYPAFIAKSMSPIEAVSYE